MAVTEVVGLYKDGQAAVLGTRPPGETAGRFDMAAGAVWILGGWLRGIRVPT
jgi:hypothetical protein